MLNAFHFGGWHFGGWHPRPSIVRPSLALPASDIDHGVIFRRHRDAPRLLELEVDWIGATPCFCFFSFGGRGELGVGVDAWVCTIRDIKTMKREHCLPFLLLIVLFLPEAGRIVVLPVFRSVYASLYWAGAYNWKSANPPWTGGICSNAQKKIISKGKMLWDKSKQFPTIPLLWKKKLDQLFWCSPQKTIPSS